MGEPTDANSAPCAFGCCLAVTAAAKDAVGAFFPESGASTAVDLLACGAPRGARRMLNRRASEAHPRRRCESSRLAIFRTPSRPPRRSPASSCRVRRAARAEASRGRWKGSTRSPGSRPWRRRQRRPRVAANRSEPLGSLALLLLHERVEIVRVHHANLDGGFVNSGRSSSPPRRRSRSSAMRGNRREGMRLKRRHRAPPVFRPPSPSSSCDARPGRRDGLLGGVARRAHALKRPGRAAASLPTTLAVSEDRGRALLAGRVVVVAGSDGRRRTGLRAERSGRLGVCSPPFSTQSTTLATWPRGRPACDGARAALPRAEHRARPRLKLVARYLGGDVARDDPARGGVGGAEASGRVRGVGVPRRRSASGTRLLEKAGVVGAFRRGAGGAGGERVGKGSPSARCRC